MARRIPWALLVMSLGVNVLLLMWPPPGPAATEPLVADRAASHGALEEPGRSGPAVARGGVAAAAGRGPQTAPSSPGARPPDDLAACAARLAIAEAQLAATRREHAALLPPSERFARGPQDRSAEAFLRPELERALAGTDAAAWDVECRGWTCRVTGLRGGGRFGPDWSRALQQDERLRERVRAVEMHATRAKTDPVSRETFDESDVYLDLREAPDPVMPELRRRLAAFKGSSALSECTAGFAARGEARFTVRLDGDGLSVVPAGSLAGTPAGRCLEERLRAALATMGAPPDGEPYQVGLALVSPPG